MWPADRLWAVTALAERAASGAPSSLTGRLLNEPHWPSRVKEGGINPFFPKHISVLDFLRRIGQIDVDKRSVGGINWTPPQLIPKWMLPDSQCLPDERALHHKLTRIVARPLA